MHVKYEIFNALFATKIDITDEIHEKYAINDIGRSAYIQNLKIALIGTTPDIINTFKKYIKIFEQARSTWEFKIFENLKDAREWIKSNKK